MNNVYYFSPSNNSFYLSELQGLYESSGSWPDDMIEVDESTFRTYIDVPPAGKKRVVNEGKPAWGDLPPPTKDEIIAAAASLKSKMQIEINAKIIPYQDAVDLDMATVQEQSKLDELKKYRVLLGRVNPSDAPDITWPVAPSIS